MVTDPALIPYIEARVVIHIHEGGIPTDRAMDLAVQAQGFRSQTRYWAWLRVYMEKKTPLVGASLWSAQRTTTNNTNSQFSFQVITDQVIPTDTQRMQPLNKRLKSYVREGYSIHSFRHSLRNRLRAITCPTDMIDQIGRRSRNTVG